MTRFSRPWSGVADREATGLEEVFAQLGQPFYQRLLDTLAALLEHPSTPPRANSGDQLTDDQSPSRVHERLADLLADKHFQDRVRRIVPLLWAPPTEEWLGRARARFLSTVGKRNSGRILFFVPGVS